MDLHSMKNLLKDNILLFHYMFHINFAMNFLYYIENIFLIGI